MFFNCGLDNDGWWLPSRRSIVDNQNQGFHIRRLKKVTKVVSKKISGFFHSSFDGSSGRKIFFMNIADG